MSDFNSRHNRAVWFDVPVAELPRAAAFYEAVLAVKVQQVTTPGGSFGVLEHAEGNGGCLVVAPGEISGKAGIQLYFNVDRRIRDAVAKVKANGGQVLEDVQAIGPHGFKATVLDSEGNRIVLHSNVDA